MGKGALTFTRTGGAQDPQSPHVVNFNGERLSQGAHYDESFDADIALKDGSVYTITFGAEDMAGNIANDIFVQDITFDASPPEIIILSPEPSIPELNTKDFFGVIAVSYTHLTLPTICSV